ncbi:MAG: septal ring lytic transglycosylase RlpA family protein [Leptotrichiaceae bacterium]|nr:septal ring lytic transglycosylase RlpA family protein [Leptotrichiaceae bacterium]
MSLEKSAKYKETAKGSWYGVKENGTATASGEIYDENRVSAAHRTLPLGTTVKVTNLDNGKSVVAVVNDRGPYIKNRIIDLSKEAFKKIADLDKGVIPVKVETVKIKSLFLKGRK